MRFEIRDRDSLARIGRWEVRGKVVETPNIAVVVNPNKMILSTREIKELGGEMLITNAYIIKNSRYKEEILGEGLHNFFDWDGLIYTDSGTFQMYSQGNVRVTNEEIIDFQIRLGSDIVTPLDEFTLPEDTREIAIKKMDETLKRIEYLENKKKKIEDEGEEGEEIEYSFPLQGGMFLDLREEIAKKSRRFNHAVSAIGGIVPLMEQYRFDDLIRVISAVKQHLDTTKPIHAFGAGHPIIFPLLTLFGVDIFDSASYALYAADKRVITEWGTRHISEIEYLYDTCKECKKKDIKEWGEKEIAMHNLYMIFKEINNIKQAIKEHSIYEYVERRIGAHPSLVKAYRLIKEKGIKEMLKLVENATRRSGSMFVREESYSRPMFDIASRRLKSVEDRGERVVWIGKKIPKILAICYPFSQFEDVSSRSLSFSEIIEYIKEREEEFIISLLQYQFHIKNVEKIREANLKLEYSKATSRPRFILRNGKEVGSIRARDNFIIPSIELAELIRSAGGGKIVAVSKEAEPYVSKGASVMAKFTSYVDNGILPYEIVFITNENRDRIIAVGESLLNSKEMKEFNYGVAVKIKRVK